MVWLVQQKVNRFDCLFFSCSHMTRLKFRIGLVKFASFGNRKKNILQDLSSSVLSKFKNHHPSGNLKFNNLGIFQSLKLRIIMEKFLLVSFKLNFTLNTSGCNGLMFDSRVGY